MRRIFVIALSLALGGCAALAAPNHQILRRDDQMAPLRIEEPVAKPQNGIPAPKIVAPRGVPAKRVLRPVERVQIPQATIPPKPVARPASEPPRAIVPAPEQPQRRPWHFHWRFWRSE